MAYLHLTLEVLEVCVTLLMLLCVFVWWAGLRLCWGKGEMSEARTVWTSCLTAGCSLFLSLTVQHLPLPPIQLAPNSSPRLFFFFHPWFPFSLHHLHLYLLFLSPSSLFLFSSPPPQRWLELSSTGSNRHQITINPASLNLPIAILLREKEEGFEAKEEKKRQRWK